MTKLAPPFLLNRLATMVRRILQRAYQGNITEFVSFAINNDQTIIGTFKDGDKLVEFNIGDKVTIAELGKAIHDSDKEDSITLVFEDKLNILPHLKEQVELYGEDIRDDSAQFRCKKGIPCKGRCIKKGFTCSSNLSSIISKEEQQDLNNMTVELSTKELEESIERKKGQKYTDLSIRELKKLAAQRDINRYSYMTRQQLINANRLYDEDPEQRERLIISLKRQKATEEGRRAGSTAVGKLLSSVFSPAIGRQWNVLSRVARAYNERPIEAGMIAAASIAGTTISAIDVAKRNREKNLTAASADALAIAQRGGINVKDTNKMGFTFLVGSYAEGSNKLAKNIDSGRAVIAKDDRQWLMNSTSLRPVARRKESVPVSGNLLEALSDYTFEGYKRTLGGLIESGKDREATELAAKLYEYGKRFPEKEMNLVGVQDGGIVTREALEILSRITENNKRTGEKIAQRINHATLGTPYFGLSDRKQREFNIIGTGDGWFNLPFQKGGSQTVYAQTNGGTQSSYLRSPRAMDRLIDFLRFSRGRRMEKDG